MLRRKGSEGLIDKRVTEVPLELALQQVVYTINGIHPYKLLIKAWQQL